MNTSLIAFRRFELDEVEGDLWAAVLLNLFRSWAATTSNRLSRWGEVPPGEVWTTIPALASKFDISEPQAKKRVAKLCRLGLIRKTVTADPDGHKYTRIVLTPGRDQLVFSGSGRDPQESPFGRDPQESPFPLYKNQDQEPIARASNDAEDSFTSVQDPDSPEEREQPLPVNTKTQSSEHKDHAVSLEETSRQSPPNSAPPPLAEIHRRGKVYRLPETPGGDRVGLSELFKMVGLQPPQPNRRQHPDTEHLFKLSATCSRQDIEAALEASKAWSSNPQRLGALLVELHKLAEEKPKVAKYRSKRVWLELREIQHRNHLREIDFDLYSAPLDELLPGVEECLPDYIEHFGRPTVLDFRSPSFGDNLDKLLREYSRHDKEARRIHGERSVDPSMNLGPRSSIQSLSVPPGEVRIDFED